MEHPYFYTAGSRLTLFADKNRWAIVFEESGYENRSYDGEIVFYYFGNCLTNLHSPVELSGATSNFKTISLITDEEIQRIEDDNNALVSIKAEKVKVRDTI